VAKIVRRIDALNQHPDHHSRDTGQRENVTPEVGGNIAVVPLPEIAS
jgi:hypothetical protein